MSDQTMPATATFDSQAIERLLRSTEYEVWLLEEVYRITEQDLFPEWPDGVIYPINSSKPQFIGHGSVNIILGDWRPGFLNAGAPLIFISIFKTIDMFFEWILQENGMQPDYRFKRKMESLKRPLTFPTAIEDRPWLKDRLIELYRNLEPLRGTIIHHKEFATAEGSLHASSSKNNQIGPVVQISASNLMTLTRVILETINYIGEIWPLTEIREMHLRYNLDQLQPLHGMALLHQKPPFHTQVRVYTHNKNLLDIDIARIFSEVSQHHPNNDCLFDLRVVIVEGKAACDAYFFPWALISNQNRRWLDEVDIPQHRVDIPRDIDINHL